MGRPSLETVLDFLGVTCVVGDSVVYVPAAPWAGAPTPLTRGTITRCSPTGAYVVSLDGGKAHFRPSRFIYKL